MMKNGLALTPLLLVVLTGFAVMAEELPTLEEAKVLGRNWRSQKMIVGISAPVDA